MADPKTLGRKITRLRKGAARLPNVSLGAMSIRQAIWQTYITKAGPEAAEILEQAAAGMDLSALLRKYAHQIEPLVFERREGHLPWQFLRAG
jgi:hypothetical protein